MSNNRKLGNLAQFLDSGSTKSVITASGGAFATEPLLQADLIGTPPGGLSDSNLVKNLIDINYITETSGHASVSDAIPVVLQNTNNIIPDSSGAYDLGDSAKPIAELILDSSSTIFFGAFSLTSILKSGTSSIAVAAVAASAEPVSGSAETLFLLKTDSTQTDAQVDASTNALTITENGNVKSTAFTPYHPKGYSLYFDNVGDYDYLTLADDASLNLSTGDFTIEAWVWVDSTTPNNGGIIGKRQTSFGGGEWRIAFLTATNKIAIAHSSENVNISTPEVTLNAWNHIAFCRSGTTLYCLANGALGDTDTSYGHNFDNAQDLYIGKNADFAFIGYMADVRILKGTALYTGSYDIPTERLTSITNTSLLTCHLPYIADGSSNDHSITITGNVEPELFSPYDHVAYSRSSYGGSVYFDGTGDYLTVTNGFPAIGTSDYTIEFWMYRTAGSGSAVAITDTRTSNTNNPLLWIKDTDEVYYFTNNADAIVGTTQTQINQWYHVALSRSSGVSKLFINGVQEGSSYNDSHSYTQDTLFLGQRYTSTAYNFEGYIADLRVVNGTAVYTADFTPPTEPSTAISGTQLLTCTNKNSIWDASGGNLLTVVGNTTTDTNTTKYSSSSIYFDGSGDYIGLPSSTAEFNTLDFTIEFWVYMNDVTSDITFFGRGISGGAFDFFIQYRPTVSNNLKVNTQLSNYTPYDFAWTPSNNTWYHIAVSRSGTDLKAFVDGTQIGTTQTDSSDISASINGSVGYNAQATGQYLNGYIEDFRITKGVARYTANFTPPTAALEG